MISAKPSPLSTPTSSSRRMMRPALALDSSRVASARTVDRHGLRAGIAAHAGDDRHQHRERDHLRDRAFEQR